MFDIGDRVIAIKAVDGNISTKGKTGTIIAGKHNRFSVGIEFDEPIEDGHSCDNRGKYGYCWWGHEFEIELVVEDVDVSSIKIDVPFDQIVN